MEQLKKRPQYGGWKPKPYLEKKVMVYGTVKRMHFAEAQKAVKELLKQWR